MKVTPEVYKGVAPTPISNLPMINKARYPPEPEVSPSQRVLFDLQRTVNIYFIIQPCDPTVVICYLIWPCDIAVHITYLISHSLSLSYNTVIKEYFRLGV